MSHSLDLGWNYRQNGLIALAGPSVLPQENITRYGSREHMRGSAVWAQVRTAIPRTS